MKKLLSLFVMLTLIIGGTIPTSQAASNIATVQFIPVGAGDSIYIESPTGDDILIDAGKSSYGGKIVSFLSKQEKNMDLEHVIITHPDSDHMGGMIEVFKKMKVKNFYYPKDAASNSKTWKTVLKLAKQEKGIKIHDTKPKSSIKSGTLKLSFVHSSKNYSSTNNDSAVLFLDYGNLEVLFAGDIEGESEKIGTFPNVDVLKVSHHGSKTATSHSFLKDCDPEKAIISTDGKSYGHPHKETLNRLKKYGVDLYRTDKNGIITIKANGKKWNITFEKGKKNNFTPGKASSSTSSNSSQNNNGNSSTKIAYITKTGKKYHLKKDCRGLSNAKTIIKTTIKDAKNKGLTICGFE